MPVRGSNTLTCPSKRITAPDTSGTPAASASNAASPNPSFVDGTEHHRPDAERGGPGLPLRAVGAVVEDRLPARDDQRHVRVPRA